MAGKGRLSEVRVKRRDLGWIRKGVWEEITCWRIVKGRKLMMGSVLATILWWWRRTGPAALLKVTRRTGPRELGIAGIAGSAILD